ncbi:MAG: GIY-YIG nuclease family protein [Patescibacteria group bacterium]
MERIYCVYIMTNPSNTVLYIGMTGNLSRRILEHKEHLLPGFTKKYNCTKLVYVESTDEPTGAIEREMELKGWRREKKEALICSINPGWRDLYDEMTS